VGVWQRMKRIATDTGAGVEPIPVGLERNPQAVIELGGENPADVHLYRFRIGMRSGFGQQEAALPVYRRVNPASHPILKEIYYCEVAGQNLEAANVFALRQKVQKALEMIAPAHTLPLCYFRAARFDYSLPVYEEGSHLTCPVITGPKLKGDELATLRGPVSRWLRAGGYLAEDEEPEVQVVRPSDLRLVPPAAVIRSLELPDLWMPTVEGVSAGTPVIGLIVHPAELSVSERRRAGTDTAPPPSAPDVTGLLRYVGGELAQRGTLLNPWSLLAADVRPEIWARTEELTDPTSRCLECFMDGAGELRLPIRHTAAGEVVAALQEERITVFLGGDEEALAASVGGYLTAAGFLRHPEDVRVESDAVPPPESLDPAEITTSEEETEQDQEVATQ
jgi:hypothetical protein